MILSVGDLPYAARVSVLSTNDAGSPGTPVEYGLGLLVAMIMPVPCQAPRQARYTHSLSVADTPCPWSLDSGNSRVNTRRAFGVPCPFQILRVRGSREPRNGCLLHSGSHVRDSSANRPLATFFRSSFLDQLASNCVHLRPFEQNLFSQQF